MRFKFRYWIPAFAWMSVIFVFSTDLFSSSSTGSVFERLLSLLFPALSAEVLHAIHFGFRKFAHVAAYAVLSYFFSVGQFGSFKPWLRPLSAKSAVGSILGCLIYASADEWHQSFSSVRTGTPVDVAWDTLGAVLAQASLTALRYSRLKVPS